MSLAGKKFKRLFCERFHETEKTMVNRVEIGGLKIDERLYRLVRDEIAPGTGVRADAFWKSLGEIVRDLWPKNRALLAKRDQLQEQIDQ